jgi:ubiquitin-like 1-activating enzyme E1 A
MESQSNLVRHVKCLLSFPLATARPQYCAGLTVALLSWLDTHPNSPVSGDLEEFSQLVDATISKLSLPATLCTSTHVQDFISQLEPQDLSGVAAVVGGILGQDVLNALGGRELPVKNWLIFDGRSCTTP